MRIRSRPSPRIRLLAYTHLLAATLGMVSIWRLAVEAVAPPLGNSVLAMTVAPFIVAIGALLGSPIAIIGAVVEMLVVSGAYLRAVRDVGSNAALAGLLLTVAAFAIGAAVLTLDDVAPMLTRRHRRWRTAPRFLTQHKIVLVDTKTGARHPALLIDCSQSGLGVAVSRPFSQDLLDSLGEFGNARIAAEYAQRSFDARVVWRRDGDGVTHLGMAVADQGIMTDLVESLAPEVKRARTRGVGGWLEERPLMREALFFGWLLTLVAAFAAQFFV